MTKSREHQDLTSGAMRSVTRTLAVIRTLNEHNGAPVSELAQLTRIPRPSLYRILEALCALGYLRRNQEERYELTLLVRTLSDGFEDETWIRGIAQPVMEALQRCTPMPFTEGMAGAVAGRPFAIQFHNRKLPPQPVEKRAWLTPKIL